MPSRLPVTRRFHVDSMLMIACLGLLAIGYVMVVSSSIHIGKNQLANIWNYPFKQFAHLMLGMASAYLIAKIPMQQWEKWGIKLFFFGVLLLVIVLIPGVGVTVNGSTRWLNLGISIQVSELVKFFSVVYMAGYVTRRADSLRTSIVGLLKPLALLGVAGVLLLLEPDFGSTVVIIATAMALMFLAGARLVHFGVLFSVVAAAGIALVIVSPYRLERVVGFLDPWTHFKTSGYQLGNALISFGMGKVLGVGLGNGVQKLFYLPEAHTDFLLSVVAEELGLVGVLTVMALFSLFIWRAFKIAEAAERIGQFYASYVAYGLGIWFGLQALINIGVNMGVLPTKGLTLPLMSYGGGSMIIMCCAVGLLCRVYDEAVEIKANTIPEPRVRVKAKHE